MFLGYSVSEILSMNPYKILTEIIEQEDISLFGWTLLQQPLSLSLYSNWIEQDYQGSMQYLERHYEAKSLESQAFLEQNKAKANSAIVIGIPYLPIHPKPWQEDPIPNLKRAAYSRGEDYHIWMSKKLKQIISKLKTFYPNEAFQSWVDSGPVLERDLAYRSGVGWVGKNTCLINKKQGSFFLIGEIYTSLVLENNNPLSSDFCGKCNRCIEACPTGALKDNRILDATKCISYWTIESKEVPNQELREKFGDWVFGCDICQNICPWNQAHLISELQTNGPLPIDRIENDLRWILLNSNKELQRALTLSALERGAGFKLKRNAIIVIGNLKLFSLKTEVENYLNQPRFTELAKWCLNQLT
jgi:epoxyqueuosine reductase